MRCIVALSLVLLIWPASTEAQAQIKITGIITKIKKTQDAPTGEITIVNSAGKVNAIVITEQTVFEKLQGKTVFPTNFLAEHQGQRVQVTVSNASKPLTADKVQIILPPVVVQPPNVKVDKAHTTGWVTMLQGNFVMVRLPHAPSGNGIVGNVTDVTRDGKANFGSMSITSPDGSLRKFTVNQFTHFEKVYINGNQPASFLGEFRNVTVVVIPRYNDPTVAAVVEIVQEGGLELALYRASHPGYSTRIYQVTPSTKYDLVRDGKHVPANQSVLQIGERLWIEATDDIANFVHVLQPHALDGQVVALSPSALSVKVYIKGTLDMPAHDLVLSVGVNRGTVYEGVSGKERSVVPSSFLQIGKKVTVYPSAVPPHAAERVSIAFPTGKRTVKGNVVGVANGSLMISVHHNAAAGKPAYDEVESFVLAPGTELKFLQGAKQSPAPLAALSIGTQVIVFSNPGPPPLATKIEIPLKAPTKK